MNPTLNWKTTAAGAAAIFANILPMIIPMLPPQYGAIASGVLTGLGLIFAKDSNVVGAGATAKSV